jgi:teichuronic acid biosynthesis glycosyltransferase TuaH
MLARRIAKVVKKQSITDFIYINSFNFHYPSIQRFLKPALCIYHSVDPMSNPFDAKHGVVSEEKIVRDSDLVICTSKQLYREKKAQNENTYFIPNSADIALSSMALDKNMQVHESIAHLKKPVIGYFGNVERRIDFELVKEMAERHADKSFVFAGPVNREQVPEWLFTTPNIHLTGPIPYHLRPSVIKGFDITMIPFKSDEFSRSVFPLKLFEYLGAGKPVISTRFNPDLEERTQQTVTFCDDAKAFSAAIAEELQNNSEQRVQARLAVAGENTWEKSVSQISTLIATNIGLVSL